VSVSLTPEELFEITGKTQPAAQLRRLRAMGIRACRGDNPERPVVVLREWLADRPSAAAESTPRLKSERKAA